MKKIETLFLRDAKGRALNAVNPGCEWVLAGEGRPTLKRDGTCCAVIDGKFYKRLQWFQGKGEPPEGWWHWSCNPEQRSGHGWILVGDGNEDWMHRDAWERRASPPPDGTYELIGPRVGKNPEGVASNMLVGHGEPIPDCERTFAGLRAYLEANEIEGIVWWHPDGRMVKLKRRDFGIVWPVRRTVFSGT